MVGSPAWQGSMDDHDEPLLSHEHVVMECSCHVLVIYTIIKKKKLYIFWLGLGLSGPISLDDVMNIHVIRVYIGNHCCSHEVLEEDL